MAAGVQLRATAAIKESVLILNSSASAPGQLDGKQRRYFFCVHIWNLLSTIPPKRIYCVIVKSRKLGLKHRAQAVVVG